MVLKNLMPKDGPVSLIIMKPSFNILSVQNVPLPAYKDALDIDIEAALETLEDGATAPRTFKFYTSISVISSSKIEGETMDILSEMLPFLFMLPTAMRITDGD